MNLITYFLTSEWLSQILAGLCKKDKQKFGTAVPNLIANTLQEFQGEARPNLMLRKDFLSFCFQWWFVLITTQSRQNSHDWCILCSTGMCRVPCWSGAWCHCSSAIHPFTRLWSGKLFYFVEVMSLNICICTQTFNKFGLWPVSLPYGSHWDHLLNQYSYILSANGRENRWRPAKPWSEDPKTSSSYKGKQTACLFWWNIMLQHDSTLTPFWIPWLSVPQYIWVFNDVVISQYDQIDRLKKNYTL